MERSTKIQEIVIVGGGIGGLATALALHRNGIKSTVIEKSETLRATGAAIIVQANGWRALEELGVASMLRETSIPIDSGRVLSIDGGKQEDIPLVGEIRCLRRALLIKALADSLPGDTIQLGCKVISIEVDKATSLPILHLLDGTFIIAKVVIGCDGVNSMTANVLGLKPPKLLSTCVVRGFTYYEDGHRHGSELLLIKSERVQLGQLPVHDKLVYWFVTRKSTPQVSKDPMLIKDSTVESLDGFPWKTVQMIKNSDVGSLHLSDLRYQAPWNLLRTNFRKGTMTVVGDAMHAMGPFIAQGGSASMEDAVVLARCLANCKTYTTTPGGGINEKIVTIEKGIDEYLSLRKMRVFWLSLQSYLIGITIETSSSSVIKVLAIFLLIILFRIPNGHTDYDPRRT
ncbi:hypothetical protein K2173_007130 [Erythroxylum novogranatense]|uniref:FAD-binding domain-containing protein n=1 Tax=Erythroxylum novogranatense TaxID=1862640 RepID=A0AAV8SZL5_9ROSI|nr:hypothetical protein K2173_007130 [Erythroxylum novogranatense]